MKKLSLFLAVLFPALIFAQDPSTTLGMTGETKSKESGKLQVGMRSTLSAFSDEGNTGFGVGGHFRLKLGSRLNTEWFADYITTDIDGLARRRDDHYGWAVQFYPFNYEIKKGGFIPYIAAGHCFDYTQVIKNDVTAYKLGRWSSAITSGAGMHYNITDRFDLSLSALYMMHMGNTITADVFKGPTGNDEVMIQKADLGLEGHLLISFSLNVYVADLWGR